MKTKLLQHAATVATFGFYKLWRWLKRDPCDREGDNRICLTGTLGVTDEFIYDNFTSQIPRGSKAFMLFDCCNSGGMGELRFRMDRNNKNWRDKMRVPHETKSGTPEWHKGKRKWPEADVISITGCDDHELSYGVTRAFLDAARKWSVTHGKYFLKYTKIVDVLGQMREHRTVKRQHGMTPQIEASRPYALEYGLSHFMEPEAKLETYTQCYCLGTHAHCSVECEYCTKVKSKVRSEDQTEIRRRRMMRLVCSENM